MVCDIDGVVADVRHRLHHVSGRRRDWDAFFAAADRDRPLSEGVALARRYARQHRLVWLTGRPERLREVTRSWLEDNGLPVETLLMRPDHDRSPAVHFKPRQVAEVAADSRIVVVVDDDPSVIDALRSKGYRATLADWVPRSASLRRAQGRKGRT